MDQDMPSKPMEHLPLTASTCGVTPDESGKIGAIPANGAAEAKENLKQFVDSVHQKAATVVTWLAAIDESANERCKKLLRSKTLSITPEIN